MLYEKVMFMPISCLKSRYRASEGMPVQGGVTLAQGVLSFGMGRMLQGAGLMGKGVGFGLKSFGYYISKAAGGQLGFCIDIAMNKNPNERALLKQLRAWLP